MSNVLLDTAVPEDLTDTASTATEEFDQQEGFGYLIGNSASMRRMYNLIERVAPTSAAVFIIGETGSGKELVARTIHQHSERAKHPFIAINCAAITTELIGSALFGHERGSFTGASQAHDGYFRQATGGTLFLDELPESAPELQTKLLRVLETGTVIPVGGKRQISVDVRVIVATNRNPQKAIQEGILREDLFHRLNTFPIVIPPLRQRRDDIGRISNYFLNQLNEETGRQIKLTQKAILELYSRDWPGNIRELKNTIQRAFILADNKIDIEHLTEDTDYSGLDLK